MGSLILVQSMCRIGDCQIRVERLNASDHGVGTLIYVNSAGKFLWSHRLLKVTPYYVRVSAVTESSILEFHQRQCAKVT